MGDWGFRKAGFDFVAFLEKDPGRAHTIELNFPDAEVVVGLAEERLEDFIRAASVRKELSLLSITPPCAGLSTASQYRSGSPFSRKPSTDERNLLVLRVVEAVKQLRPLVVCLENVPGFRTRTVLEPLEDEEATPIDLFLARLENYEAFVDVVQMADYGVPQRRERLVAVLTRRGLRGESLTEDILPPRSHSRDGRDGLVRWPSAKESLADYPPLDGRRPQGARDPEDPLHVVPSYTRMRYDWVSRIPPHSGRSAYENAECEKCGWTDLPPWIARCGRCHAVVRGRPRIYDAPGRVRLIKGRHSSYRRMPSELPVPTLMTNNGHYGGDTKIHPWQNRVLSVREVLDHQTVPRDFNWPKYRGRPWVTLIRESVGESVPPWFTFRLGERIRQFLRAHASTSTSVSLMMS